MNAVQEEQIRSILRKHIDVAIDEIAEAEIIVGTWWPAGNSGRMSKILTESIALMAESCAMEAESHS